MDELLAKATHGVEPGDPGAFVTIFANLMRLVPWGQLILWQVVFLVVAVALGAWRGRLAATLGATLVFGPFGWVVPFLPRRAARPPPLPGSKNR